VELHLFRHGQTNWNEERRVPGQSESQLTEWGIEQARELGQRIKAIEFDRVYCSSSVRTRQTAEHALGAHQIEIEYLDTLREIFLGPWEGKLYEEIEAAEPDSFRHFWEEPHLFAVEGAESFFELQQRAIGAIRNIHNGCAGQRVAIVSHGALIKSVLAHYQALDMSELWTPPHMHNCAHSIINLQEDGSGQIVLYANEEMLAG